MTSHVRKSLLFFVSMAATAACVSSAPSFDFGDGGPPPNAETGPTAETGTDARAPDAGPPCNLNAPFKRSENQPFQNVNTSTGQVGASLSPDELTVYFENDHRLAVATRTTVAEPFTNAKPLPMQDAGCEEDDIPAMAADQKRIFFQCVTGGTQAGVRTMTRSDPGLAFGNLQDVVVVPTHYKFSPRLHERAGRLELWLSVTPDGTGNRNGDQIYQFVSTDNGASFGAPIERTDLNDPNRGDGFAVLTPDGLQVYFASGRGDPSNSDIYSATRPNTNADFQGTTRVDALSDSVGDEAPDWISPDGCRLYYHSSRAGGVGGYDLYLAERPK